jgi:hypothetical protein
MTAASRNETLQATHLIGLSISVHPFRKQLFEPVDEQNEPSSRRIRISRVTESSSPDRVRRNYILEFLII